VRGCTVALGGDDASRSRHDGPVLPLDGHTFLAGDDGPVLPLDGHALLAGDDAPLLALHDDTVRAQLDVLLAPPDDHGPVVAHGDDAPLAEHDLRVTRLDDRPLLGLLDDGRFLLLVGGAGSEDEGGEEQESGGMRKRSHGGASKEIARAGTRERFEMRGQV
jgi:hypothetical protein